MMHKELQTEYAQVRPAWYLYVLQCRDGTLYTGATTDPARRLAQHQGLLKGGARYTSARRPVVLVACWVCPDRVAAYRAEYAYKRLSAALKRAYVVNPATWDLCGCSPDPNFRRCVDV